MKYRGQSAFGILLGASLLLSACGGGDGGSTGSNSNTGNGTTSISGSAATGAALTSGTVELSCKDGLKKTGIAISATGTWSSTVPTANLPCAVKASDGSHTYYSFTVGNGSSLVTNVTPLTTLALAKILGSSPATLFASLSATDLAKLNDSAITAAIAALNTALANYALPGNFNPVTSPLTAAATGQTGNDYDRLLDQFQDANPNLDTLVTAAATGTLPTLATPSYTPGAASFSEFFSTFAGHYTLTVANAGAEGANNAAVTALFPANSSRTVHIQSNGDVSIDAAGRTLSYTAASYSAVADRFDAGSVNVVRYRAGGTTSGNCCDLYIKYDSSTGKLEVDPSGFVNNEGYATLKGTIFVPPPAPPVASCSSGDDKLVFTGGPADFCGFTKNTSGNNIAHYYQFTSSSGSHGITYVKFDTNSDDSTVLKVTIENDAYAYGCGGAFADCNGVTISTGSTSKQFTLNNTALSVINGASQGITVSGLLIHPVSSSGGGSGSTPSTPAGKLAAAFGAGFSGTYSLSCSGTPHTVTINTDGSSLIDSTPLVGTTGYGRMEISSANTITGKYYLQLINNSTILNANLYFNGDAPDTSTSWDIKPPGASVSQFCTLVSAPTARFNRLNALKTLAPLSANLGCTASAPAASAELADGTQTFSLAADGSLTLGALSASTVQTGRSSLQVSFFDAYAASGSVWYEPAFYTPVSAAANTRYVDVRFAGNGSTLTSAKFYGASGSNSPCIPAS